MKKRIMSLVIAGALFFSSAFSVNAQDGTTANSFGKRFSDVKQGDWFYSAVSSASDKKLFAGVSETEFAPNANMTRAMFVQVLANFTKNYKAPARYEIRRFTDVKKSDWYYDAVQWASINGVAAGKGEGIFDPEGKVTRGEMVTMLFNYALNTGEKTNFIENPLEKFSDYFNVSEWAEYPMRWAVSNKIVVGADNNALKPSDYSTRAEVAAMFNNAYNVMQVREMPQLKIRIPDNPELAMFYMSFDTLEKLSSSGNYKKGGDIGDYHAYTDFPEYPGLTAYTHEVDVQHGDPHSITRYSLPMKTIFPELVGKSAGEMYDMLKPESAINYWPYDTSHTYLPRLFLSYITKNLVFEFGLDSENMTVSEDTPVFFTWIFAQNRVEIPDDLKLAVNHKGDELCKVTLTESYRKSIIYDSGFFGVFPSDSGLFINEPISRLRYDAWSLSGFTALAIAVLPEENVTFSVDKINRFEKDGITYVLFVSDSTDTPLYPFEDEAALKDPEVVESFKKMSADVGWIIENIQLNDEIQWLD